MSDDEEEPEAIELAKADERLSVEVRFGYWKDVGDPAGRLVHVPHAYAVQIRRRAHPKDDVRTVDCGAELAAARAKFDETVAGLRADGWGAPPPKAPPPKRDKPAPSKARAPGPKPDWMANAPAALGKQLASWKTAAKKAGLAHRFDEIAVLARPAIDLALKKAKPADLKKVVSRLGGDPDLPAGFAWPVVDGVALTFVAQIVIADMKVHDLDARLPAAGLLAVFAQLDATAAAYGEVCRVVLFPFDATLVRTASPPGVKRPIRSAGTFAPKLRLTLPPSEGPAIDGLGLNADERAAYHDDLFLGAIPEGRLHRLLGWPSAATHHGIAGHAFLLQIDSEDRIDFEMGDAEQLRIFVDGPAGARPLDANALAGAVCTLSEA